MFFGFSEPIITQTDRPFYFQSEVGERKPLPKLHWEHPEDGKFVARTQFGNYVVERYSGHWRVHSFFMETDNIADWQEALNFAEKDFQERIRYYI